MFESDYLKQETENHSDEAEYLSDLRILRRFVQNGSFGYRESKDAVFQRLKVRYPEAYGSAEANGKDYHGFKSRKEAIARVENTHRSKR